MKKLLVLLLALAVIVTACAQKPAEIVVVETSAAPADIPAAPAETPPVETPAVPAEETPVETPKKEVPKVETPVVPAETPKADEMTYEVAIGDEITYKDTAFTIDNIANSGNELYLNFNAFILKLKGLNKPEILNDVEYKIASNENVKKAGTVTLNVKPLTLEKNQYLIMKDKSVTVNNTILTLGEVKQDTSGMESAYFSVGGYEYWVKLKGTLDAGTLSVTLDRIFYQQRSYAILTIVPK